METRSYRYFYNESKKMAIKEILKFMDSHNVESLDLSEFGDKLPLITNERLDSIEVEKRGDEEILKFTEYSSVFGKYIWYASDVSIDVIFNIADFIFDNYDEIEKIIKDQNPEEQPRNKYRVNLYYSGSYSTTVKAYDMDEAKELARYELDQMSDGEFIDALNIDISDSEVIEDK